MKERLIIITTILAAGILSIVLTVIFPRKSTAHSINQNTPTVSPTLQSEQSRQQKNITPTVAVTSHTTQATSDAVFAERVKNPPPLSPTDLQAKTALINSLPANQEVLYTNSEFTVLYIQPFDMFQVNLNSINITQSETDATSWFISKGFSKEAVCNLPVMFAPTYQINLQLQSQGIEIPSLGEGC